MVVHVDVQEHDDKKPLENPGGEEFMKRLGGGGGLPFIAFLDDRGAMLANSNAPAKLEAGKGGYKGGNIGHPDAPEEVDWFMEMLSKGAAGMTPEERGTIENRLRHQKK